MAWLLLWVAVAVQAAAQDSLQWELSSWFAGRKEAHALSVDARGRMWIATANEIFVDDGITCEPLNILPANQHQYQFGGAYITCLAPQGDSLMWLSAKGGGLFRIHQKTGEVTHWRFDPDEPGGIQDDHIWNLLVHQDAVWLCTQTAGLVHFDPASEQFTTYPVPKIDFPGFKPSAREAVPDRSDPRYLWVATASNFYRFDTQERSYQRVSMDIDPPVTGHLNDLTGYFTVIHHTNGNVYLGTWFDGLWEYNPTTGEVRAFLFAPYNRANWEASTNLVHQIESINDRYLLITNIDRGNRVFDLQTETWLEHPKYTALPRDWALRAMTGYAAGGAGFIPCPTGCQEIRVAGSKPFEGSVFPGYLKTVDIHGKRQREHWDSFFPATLSLHYSDTLKLVPTFTQLWGDQREMDLRVGSEDWSTVRPTESWSPSEILKAGTQTVQLRYRSEGGEWSPTVTVLHLEVTREWHTYPAVQLGGSVLFALLILGGIRIQRRRKQRMQERELAFEKRLAETQMAALRSQMNPHFLFNSLNSIKDFIVRNEQRDAVNYLQTFSELVRAILENSKRQRISLARELETVRLYVELERLRFEHRFSLTINTEDCPDLERLSVPPMIIQPYVENAILHGLNPKQGPGNIHITCTLKKDQLWVEVEDDGIGRTAAQSRRQKGGLTRTSMGMNITQERIQLAAGQPGTGVEITDLFHPDGTPAGTRVTLQLTAEHLEHE